MRKYIRNQIINIIESIQEGLHYIENVEPCNSVNVLVDCYDATQIVVNALNDNISSDALDEYATLVSHIYHNIEILYNELSSDVKNIVTIHNVINDFNLLEKKVNQIEVQYEVLFIPYNASMWDCMESIWKEAESDKRVTAYVMPVRYYNRNSDQSLGQMFYEGHLFPEYVKVIDYNAYDLESRHPDIIYTHFPYDNNNLVTTLDERYYSENLKKYTDQLVYVPYYISNGYIDESMSNLLAATHFDKIVVESDFQKQKLSKKISPDVLIALGNPKVDKVIDNQINKPQLPDEWVSIIGNKKVILYNTSLFTLLNYGVNFIRHIVYTLEVFSKRDDVVLLWRPHPLSKNTFKSLNPQLLNQYIQLENYIKKHKIGILDESSDFQRAIAISDAYYGDYSSVLQVFRLTGKPAMIRNTNISREPNENELRAGWFTDAVIEDDKAWIVEGDSGSLCEINLNNGMAKRILTCIPDESGSFLYNIVKNGHLLFLVPLKAKEAAIYDLNTREITKIKLQDSNVDQKFSKGISYGQYIYLFPQMYHAIVRYDTKTGELIYFTEIYDLVKKHISNYELPYFGVGIHLDSNTVYIPFSQKNYVIKFNMDNHEVKIIEIGNKNNKYWNISKSNKYMWLIQHNNKGKEHIARWNPSTKQTLECEYYPNEYSKSENSLQNIVTTSKGVFFFPRFSNDILRVDEQSNKMEILNLPNDVVTSMKSEYNWSLGKFLYAQNINNEYILALNTNDFSLLKIDIKTNEIDVLTLQFEDIDLTTYSENSINTRMNSTGEIFFMESKFHTLSSYLDDITHNRVSINYNNADYYQKMYNNSDGTAGKKIHHYIMNEVEKL